MLSYERNENKFTLGVFIDFSKAFDTVNHKILLKKLLWNYLDWFKSYWRNRKQFISYKDRSSSILIQWNIWIADTLYSGLSVVTQVHPVPNSLLKLPLYSGQLRIADTFVKTRRCPLFRGFTVYNLCSTTKFNFRTATMFLCLLYVNDLQN